MFDVVRLYFPRYFTISRLIFEKNFLSSLLFSLLFSCLPILWDSLRGKREYYLELNVPSFFSVSSFFILSLSNLRKSLS